MREDFDLRLGRISVWIVVLMLVVSQAAFAATRPVVTAMNGMVAAAHPLASQAGLDILKAGGNAVDAAVAVAATLSVVEPDLSSIAGGGAFLIFDASTNTMRIINANAPAPAGADVSTLTRDDALRGYKAGMVPAALAAWAEALENYGTMSLAEVLEPAIYYAEEGFPITARLADSLRNPILTVFPTSAQVYQPGGKFLRAGELLVQSGMARTLRTVAEKGVDEFYKGDLAREMAAFYEQHDGTLTYEDIASYEVDWEEPVVTTYRGYEIATPGGEWGGSMLIEQLNIVEAYDLRAWGRDSVETLHVMIEATRLAGIDRDTYIADPRFEEVPIDMLTSKEYAARQRARISMDRAMETVAPGGSRPEGPENTTHISVVDRWGNMVAYTTSIGSGWGTGVVIGETGVLLNNGGGWMSFDENDRNALRPGKRPMNNIAPVLISKDGKPFLTLGTPGGDAIWQTMFQLIVNLIDFEMDIQDAIEYPRYRVYEFGGNLVRIEPGFPQETIDGLIALGHNVEMYPALTSATGGAQGIVVDLETGAMMGGADPRRDGYVAGW